MVRLENRRGEIKGLGVRGFRGNMKRRKKVFCVECTHFAFKKIKMVSGEKVDDGNAPECHCPLNIYFKRKRNWYSQYEDQKFPCKNPTVINKKNKCKWFLFKKD